MEEMNIVPSPELVKGLAKFRENLKQPERSQTVDTGKYKYSYASLNDVIKSIDDAIKDTGLSYLQVQEVDPRTVTVRTVIVCEGDRIDTGFVQMAAGGNPQAIGSAITYARRYSLSTAFGIAPDDDDDGQLAQESYNRSNQPGYQNNRQNGNQQRTQQRPPQRQTPQNNNQQPQQQAPQQNLKPSQQPADPVHVQTFRAEVAKFAKAQGAEVKATNQALFTAASVEPKHWAEVTVAELAALNAALYQLNKKPESGEAQ